MKYFKSSTGAVYAFESDGSQDNFISDALVPMSQGEVGVHLKSVSIPSAIHVNIERDRRAGADVEFKSIKFQSRPIDRERIIEATQLALIALDSGAKPGDLRWLDPEQDFTWIAADNTLVPMDAPTVVAFAKAMAARTQALVLAGRRLKDMDAIPSDYTDDKWWP